MTIKFIECICPVGFEQLSNSQSSTKCECVCDSALSPYITECNITTSSVLRKATNSWITYINDTDPPNYIIMLFIQTVLLITVNPNKKTLPLILTFLMEQTHSVLIITLECCVDSACKEDLSLSLASSRCVPCHTHWPAAMHSRDPVSDGTDSSQHDSFYRTYQWFHFLC